MKPRIGRRRGVPVQLGVYATRPLNDCVSTDRIIEGVDEHICAGFLGCANRLVKIRDQIAAALQSEWVGDRCFKSEYRQCPHRRQDQLRHRAARGWSYCEYALLGGCATKGRDQAGHETVEVFRSNVDMCGVVLRPHGHTYRFACLRSLCKTRQIERSNRKSECQNQCKAGPNGISFEAHFFSPKLTIT